MLQPMTALKRILIFIIILLVSFQLAGCGQVTPVPTTTARLMPSLTPSIPSIIPTATLFPTVILTSTPDFCSSTQWNDKIQVLSNNLLGALEPGGPTVFDRILVEQNSDWADFRQYDHGEMRSAGIIFHETAFGPELGTGVNPAVILVTYGVERNWELPANGDLVSEVDRIRATLRQHESDWILGKVNQNQYPMVANGATYVLYRYFNGDLRWI